MHLLFLYFLYIARILDGHIRDKESWYQSHIGVVGSNDLTKNYLYRCYAVTMPRSLASNLIPFSVAEDWFRLFRPANYYLKHSI